MLIPKNSNAKECLSYHTIVLISHASRVMLKILQARLQQCEPRTSRCTSWIYKTQRNQRSNSQHSLDHREKKCFPKNIYVYFIDYTKAFDCVDQDKLWEILKGVEIKDHLTCLLKNLYVHQEATVRTGHGTTDWFKIGKGVRQGCILLPCLFNSYAEYLIQDAGWMNHKLESRIPGEISTTSDMQTI